MPQDIPLIRYCRDYCGHCPQCRAATAAETTLDALYASLSEADLDGLLRPDPDDPLVDRPHPPIVDPRD